MPYIFDKAKDIQIKFVPFFSFQSKSHFLVLKILGIKRQCDGFDTILYFVPLKTVKPNIKREQY